MSTIKREDNLFSLPIQPNVNYLPRKQELNDFTPFNFTNHLLKEQAKTGPGRGKASETIAVKIEAVKLEEEAYPSTGGSPESITPSPMSTEDEEDTTGTMLIYAIYYTKRCKHIDQ